MLFFICLDLCNSLSICCFLYDLTYVIVFIYLLFFIWLDLCNSLSICCFLYDLTYVMVFNYLLFFIWLDLCNSLSICCFLYDLTYVIVFIYFLFFNINFQFFSPSFLLFLSSVIFSGVSGSIIEGTTTLRLITYKYIRLSCNFIIM